MYIIWKLTTRNIKLFLRNRSAVFFSLLSVFIIIGLYAIFLGDTNVQSIRNAIGSDVPGIRWLVDSWIMAGILVVNSITVTLAMFGIMIEDERDKHLSSFLAAPLKRSHLVLSYLFAAVIVGIMLSHLALVLAQIYIIANGGKMLDGLSLLKVMGLIVYSVTTSACIIFFITTWVKTSSGFSTMNTILGTIIGFITGIYLPIGIMPETLQTIMKYLPPTHTAALMRQIMTRDAISEVFADAPVEIYDRYTEMYGIRLFNEGQEIPAAVMLGFVGISGLFFLVLSIWRMRQRKLESI